MTELVAAFPSETAMLDAMARLSGEDEVEFETFGPNWPADPSEAGSLLGLVIPFAGVCGAAFILGLECLSTVSSWGYPVDIGGRPKFSWPAYMPIAVCWGLFCAALAAVLGFILLSRLLRLWEAVDEAGVLRGSMRETWVLAVRSENDEVIERIRPVLFSISPLPVDTVPESVEEIPA